MASQLIKETEMAKYRVNLLRVDSFIVTVEAENEDEAVDKAFDEAPSLGANEAGWGRKWSIDDGEWMSLEDFHGSDYKENRHGPTVELEED
jgi:hypothetical protein